MLLARGTSLMTSLRNENYYNMQKENLRNVQKTINFRKMTRLQTIDNLQTKLNQKRTHSQVIQATVWAENTRLYI